MVTQIQAHGVDAVRSDQFRGLGLELGQLQDSDFGRVVQRLRLYRIAV
jgi:hypothetical protein